MRSAWCVGMFLLLAVTAVGGGRSALGAEPVYEDRRLSNWLGRLGASSKETRQEAREAIKAIGADAVPFMVWWLRDADEDADLETRLRKLLDDESWERYWSTPDRYRRMVAGRAFRLLGPIAAPAVPELVSLLSHPKPEIRESAARSLGYLGEEARAAVADLIRLTRDRDKEVREGAVLALGRVSAPTGEVVDAVAAVLDLENPEVAGAAAKVFDDWGKSADEAVPALIELLKQQAHSSRHHPFSSFNRFATHIRNFARTVGKVGAGRRDVYFSLLCLRRTADQHGYSVGFLTEGLEAWLSHSGKSLRLLMEIVRDESRPTDDRNDAIGLLAKAKESEKVAELLLALLDDKTRSPTRIQEHPADGSNVSSQEGPPPPSPEVTSDDPAFVECLMETLPRLNVRGGAIIPIYLRLGYLDIRMFSNRLESAQAALAQNAYKNLKDLYDSREAFESFLAKQLRNASDWRIRATATAGLKKHDDLSDDAMGALKEAVDDPNAWVRFYSAVALTEKGVFESTVLDALFAGIADSSLPARLRAGAIYHTGIVVRDNVASEEPVEALIGASDDPDVAVRIAAVRALGKFGRDSAPAVPRLISLLDDRKTQQFGKTPYAVRAFAAETLGEIGAESRAALPKLRKIAAGVESPVTQKFAKAATEKIESAIASESGRALP